MRQADINRLHRAADHIGAALTHLEKVRENNYGELGRNADFIRNTINDLRYMRQCILLWENEEQNQTK